MIKNPINSLFMLGILFWLPQLGVYRNQLGEAQRVLTFLAGHQIVYADSAKVGPVKLAGATEANPNSSTSDKNCIFRYLKISTEAQGETPGKVFFETQVMADSFLVKNSSASVAVTAAQLKTYGVPEGSGLQFSSINSTEQMAPFFSEWHIGEAATQKRISDMRSRLSFQQACIPYGAGVVVTGYLTEAKTMAFTVSSPFALLYGEELEAQKALMAVVSRNYFGAAVVFLMIASLSLAIMTNSLLRGRINLEFEPISEVQNPLRAREGDDRTAEFSAGKKSAVPQMGDETILFRVAPFQKEVQFIQRGNLPVFYRYSWDDGISLKGRSAIFSINSKGLFVLELNPKDQPLAQREILWNDLFCVYFTQWAPTDYWLDIVTREGERYQLSLKSAKEAQELLKRWDATHLLRAQTAA